MISPEEAVEIVLSKVDVLPSEVVGFLDASGRVLAEDLAAPEDMPGFDRSAMDGYAVRADGVADATREDPAVLKLVGLARAGEPADVAVGPGEAVRIMTGGVVPPSADAVVMQEVTEEVDDGVRVFEPCPAKANICFRGEDVLRGDRLMEMGALLAPAAVGLLAAIGRTEIPVVRCPRVAILATGDELVDVEQTPGPGQIRNSNQYSLHALVREAGGEPTLLGAARDEKQDLLDKVRAGLEFDALVSTGGVSVGDFDLVTDIYNELGVEIFFEKIAVKPGKPVVFGKRGGCLVFGLPGNPTSTVVSFLEFVRPALLKMAGRRRIFLERRRAVLGEAVGVKPGRKKLLRAVLDETGDIPVARLAGHQGSGNLLGAAVAECLLEVGADTSVMEEGTEVTVQMFPHVKGDPHV